MQGSTAAPSGPVVARRRLIMLMAGAGCAAQAGPSAAKGKSAREIAQDARIALDRLYAVRPEARGWGRDAKAIMVFPSIVKAGFMIGGQTGEGAMFVRNAPVAFYRISAASFGLQAGAQSFSYAMFYMTDDAVEYAKSSKGWAVGSGPSVVVMDEGKAKNMNTTTLRKDIYAVAFGQQGLMGGLGMEGSKISRIYPDA